MDRKRLRRAILLGLVTLAFIAGVFGGLYALIPRRALPAALVEDTNSLRNIIGLLVQREAFPFAADGRLDAYAAFEPDDPADGIEYLRSVRAGKGPTLREVRARDYRNFPWVRYQRTGREPPTPGKGRVPLLWDGHPDQEGVRVVAFSNGAVKWIEDEEFRELLARHGQR